MRLALLSLLVLAVPAHAAEPPKLFAVLPLSHGKDIDDNDREVFEEDVRNLCAALLRPRGFTVLTGETMARIFADNGIDANKACDASCALDAAKEMKAKLFISGSLRRSEGELIAFVRIYDDAGGVLVSQKFEGKKFANLREQVEAKAPAMFDSALGGAGPATPAAPAFTPEASVAAPSVISSEPHVTKGTAMVATGDLTIDAKPRAGVRLEVTDPDGKKSSSGAPFKNARAAVGKWRVVASASGYEEKALDFDVPPEETTLQKLELSALRALKVSGTPNGAKVTVSGRAAFTTTAACRGRRAVCGTVTTTSSSSASGTARKSSA